MCGIQQAFRDKQLKDQVKKQESLHFITTNFGFEWGPVGIERACSDDKRGCVVLLLKTKKYPKGIEMYVTKSGIVRFASESGSWFERQDEVKK
jgi:hypothetical protein